MAGGTGACEHRQSGKVPRGVPELQRMGRAWEVGRKEGVLGRGLLEESVGCEKAGPRKPEKGFAYFLMAIGSH